MVIAVNQIVDAPSIFSTKHNLLDSAHRKDVSQSRWENGAVFNPAGCYDVFTQEADCPPQMKSDVFQECPDPVIFMPFVVEFGVGFMAHENEGELEKELDIKTSAAVERAIWAGVSTSTNSVFADTVPPAPTATSVRQAVGLVEAKLMEFGLQGGTIHLSAFDAAQGEGMFEERDGNLYTSTCLNPVIVGNYPRGYVFIHGGEIDVYVSEEFTTDSYEELRENRLLYKVERLVLAVWNPCFTFMEGIAAAGGLGSDPQTFPNPGPTPDQQSSRSYILFWLAVHGAVINDDQQLNLTKDELLALVADLLD